MKVLLVEDDPDIVSGVTLTFKLRWPDAAIITIPEGFKAVDLAGKESPDIIILDINLPDISGFEVLKRIRLFSDTPVIILSVRGDEVDQLRGLETGADDYLTKPFSPANLLARIRAVLRRSGIRNLEEENMPPLAIGNIMINFALREVYVDQQPVHLTPTECRVLVCLARNEGKVVTQDAIKQSVWGSSSGYIDNGTLKRYIYQLRAKLGDTMEDPRLILNEHGVGYRLMRPQGAGQQLSFMEGPAGAAGVPGRTPDEGSRAARPS
ncbi:MAG: response regulator transcription factor [Chloroflexi bacterium]|nr:response regulator transcription factor [Chloroflexota bacterium]